MAESNDDALRDYLIGILNADGPESAEHRLALRDAWHQSQKTLPANAAVPQAGTSDRHVQWEQLISLADRSPAPGDLVNIAVWKSSDWPDVRDTAQRLEEVRRQWAAIEEIWPPQLDVRLRELFLRILSSPVTRTAQLREQLRRELSASIRSRRAFRHFADHFRRRFPDLAAYDPELLSELLRTVKPVSTSPPRNPSSAKKNEPSMVTAALIVCGVLGGLTSGLTSWRDRVKPPPPKLNYPPQLTQPLPEPLPSKYSVQEFLERWKEQQRNNGVGEAFGSLEHDHEDFVRRLLPSALDTVSDSEPADALQPANRAASGEAP